MPHVSSEEEFRSRLGQGPSLVLVVVCAGPGLHDVSVVLRTVGEVQAQA